MGGRPQPNPKTIGRSNHNRPSDRNRKPFHRSEPGGAPTTPDRLDCFQENRNLNPDPFQLTSCFFCGCCLQFGLATAQAPVNLPPETSHPRHPAGEGLGRVSP